MRMVFLDQRELERTRYWHGQMLKAGDFRGQLSTDLQLRWWHNRALHQAYGVALGFDASPVLTGGALTALQFEPGVAHDCYGRALVLLQRQTVQLPRRPRAGRVTLVVRYLETSEFPDPRGTDGVCLTRCEGSLAQETPDFVWRPSDSLTPRDGVPLVRVIFDSKGIGTLDTSLVVLSPRPLGGPYLANGSTVPGATPWALWVEAAAGKHLLGVQTVVDTSSAGFTRTPCYFASLEGLDPALLVPPLTDVIFTHIEQASTDSFLFRVFIGVNVREPLAARATAQSRQSQVLPYVCWLGCESRSDTDACLKPEARKLCCS